MVAIFSMMGAFVGLFLSLVYGVIFMLTGGMPTPSGEIISPIMATFVYVLSCGAGGAVIGSPVAVGIPIGLIIRREYRSFLE